MAPGGVAGKRKRLERSDSRDSVLAEQPPTKSPRGSRFPNNLHAHAHPQGQNRENSQRGGRGGRGGGRAGRASNNQSNHPRQPSTNGSLVLPKSVVLAADSAPSQIPLKSPTQKEQDVSGEDDPRSTPSQNLVRCYKDITDVLLRSWQDVGKNTVIEHARDARNAGDHVRVGCLFQEILFSGLDGRLDPKEVGDTIKQIINESTSAQSSAAPNLEAAEAFLDTVAIACSNDTKNIQLRQILFATGIPPETIVINLGDDMLEALKLVRPQWSRMGIRHQTNALYRQANYNLLREETEGYSKLATELFATVENEQSTIEVAENSFTRVKAMIGAFNLDVGRVLDVTMDVFAAILIQHSSFLVNFLHNSSWWPRELLVGARHSTEIALDALPTWAYPEDSLRDSITEDLRYQRDEIFWSRAKEAGLKAFFELGARRADVADLDSILPILSDDTETIKDKDGAEKPKSTPTRSDILRKWIEATGTLPPQGNQDAAQILGFKLRFYTSTARDACETLPSNLIYLAAFLIKIGFISFLDLYPHLWPADEDMSTVKRRLEKEKEVREKDRKPGGKNALELAGALVDDALPQASRKMPEPLPKLGPQNSKASGEPGKLDKPVEETKTLPDAAEQKIQFLKSLLCIGAIPESLFMLGQFPWLIDLVPELPEHINRIVHQSLSLFYDQIRPLKSVDGVNEPEKFADTDQLAVQKGSVQLKSNSQRKTVKWALIDKANGNDGVNHKFYWEAWTDNVPLCHDIDHVFLLCNTLLNLNGFKIGKDPLLMAKLTRIGLHSLTEDGSEENRNRWTHLCKRLLVPALSLADRNSGSVAEVWNLLKRFPTSTRYNIYFEWYLGQTSRNNDIKVAFNYTQAETKDVLKKISKTNTRPMARLLAKVAVASPGKVFEVVIKQIESYDNLISVIVEASRYFTDLGYDVLTWSLINALGKARSRVQTDGMLTSRWLSKLAQFCGTVFKRYAVMNPIPVLQYVTNQLLNHNSTDLVVLEHLVFSMTGITQDATFNDNQVIAMCGGPALRLNTMIALLDQRSDPNMKNSTKRLMKALATSNLTGALLIGISQERQSCVFDADEADSHLKLLGNLFDEIHRVLTQYIDMLQTNLSDQEFKTLIPSIAELIGKFGIEPSVAFWIWRPTISSDIAAYDKAVMEKTIAHGSVISENASKDVEIADNEPATDMISSTKATTHTGDTQEGDVTDEVTENQELLNIRLGHPVVQDLTESVIPVLPDINFEMISDSFYFTFWRMSPYHLYIPETYQEESKRLTAKIDQLKNERGGTATDVRNREAQRKQLTDQHAKNHAELKDHLTTYQRTKATLNKEKDFWFQLSSGSWDDLNVAILEHCFIPRMTLSSVDSFFVFKMLKVLHSIGAKNFRTMGLLDCFFNGRRLIPMFFACTAKEAENIGRFLSEVLKDLNKWHASKDLYEKEAFGAKKDLPGFKKNLSVVDSFLDHESFRTLYAKWHRNLHDALRDSLKSPEYMHIRNAIIILKTVVQVFPAVEWMGKNLEEAIKHISVTEARGDLKLSAMALLGILRRRSNKWVPAPVFARHKPGQPNGLSASKSGSSPTRSPGPTKSPAEAPQSSKFLNAKAANFVPGTLSINPTKKRDARGEAEDGEIRTPLTAKLQHASTSNNGVILASDQEKTASKVEEISPPKLLSSKPGDRLNDKPARPIPESRRQELPPRPDLTTRPQSHQLRQVEPSRNHNVPLRPDNNSTSTRPQLPRLSDRPPDRLHTRDNNNPRESEYRHPDRPYESSKGSEPDRRISGRTYDRPYHNNRDQEPSWTGDRSSTSRAYDEEGPLNTRPSLRDDKSDRTHRDAPPIDPRDRYREGETLESKSRESSRTPRSAVPIHSDRTALLKAAQEQDRSQNVGYPDRRHEPTRPDHEHVPPRESRGSSPVRRGEEPSSRSEHKRYDDRQTFDNRRPAEQISPRIRNDDLRSYHPSRSEQHSENPSNSHGDQSRDDPRNSRSTRPEQGSNWGFKQDTRPPARQQDSNYGRLNQDAPSGPRSNDPNLVPLAPRHTRQVSSQQAVSESRSSAASNPVPTPSGPASSRGPTRSASGFIRPQPISTTISAATTSTSSSPDAAGIHPDRLKALQSGGTSFKSLPSQAPAGPRNTVPESNSARSGSGATNGSDNGRGRSDKRFAQLNNVLSQTNGVPVSDRPQGSQSQGRGDQTSSTSSPITNLPPTRILPPSADNTTRQDQVPSRPPGNLARKADNTRSQRLDDRQIRLQEPQPESPRQRLMHNNSREYMRLPPNGDGRGDVRGRGGPQPHTPPINHQQQPDRERGSTRENLQGDRNTRRDIGRDEWADQRTGPRRDIQQDSGGNGRKRLRGNEEIYDQGQTPFDQSKRPRRG